MYPSFTLSMTVPLELNVIGHSCICCSCCTSGLQAMKVIFLCIQANLLELLFHYFPDSSMLQLAWLPNFLSLFHLYSVTGSQYHSSWYQPSVCTFPSIPLDRWIVLSLSPSQHWSSCESRCLYTSSLSILPWNLLLWLLLCLHSPAVPSIHPPIHLIQGRDGHWQCIGCLWYGLMPPVCLATKKKTIK